MFIKDIDGWNWKSWLWVLLCIAAIFSLIPFARSFQKFINSNLGKEFFTYIILFVVFVLVVLILYFFFIRLKIKIVSQYIWLFASAGLYAYFTVWLEEYPEEAIHLLEYGILSFFVFNALSYKIRDWTVYISTVLFVLFVGISDEFIQWVTPGRYWGMKDIGINTLSAVILQLAISKGIRPVIISETIKKISVKILLGILTLDLIFIGLCLSNTPDHVNRYTAVFDSLSWLKNEEAMTKFRYEHEDPEIGIFYSRLTLEKIKEYDLNISKAQKTPVLKKAYPGEDYNELAKTYMYTDPFLYEFLMHLKKRGSNFKKFQNNKDRNSGVEAFKRNSILEKYFGNTLKYNNQKWPDEKTLYLKKTVLLPQKYTAERPGIIITFFSLKTAWLTIIIFLVIAWISGMLWRKRIEN
jgi:hypothetical protein